jgi:hypothetical protein
MGGLQFLAPFWLMAALPLLGTLVILYFLKLKRREIAVSSTYLWKKALEDLRVNSPFQRLRMNILLLLQLLVLAAVLLALARPIASLKGLTERNQVILIDRSASMAATDGGDGKDGKTRLARGLEEARRLIDGLGISDKAVVIAFDEQAELLTPLTDQKAVLRDALQKVLPTDRRTNLRSGIEVARGVLMNLKQPVLTIISDGRVGDTKGVAVPRDVEVHYVKCGEVGENLAVTSLEVRRAFERGEASRVFATVYNAGDTVRKVGVDCFCEGDLIASREVEVGKHQAQSVVFESPKLKPGRLRVAVDASDALPVDDVAYAILCEKRDVKVLLVTEGNPFLEKSLEEDSLVRKDADGTLPHLSPSQFSPEDPGLKAFDLIVLDRVEPKTLPPGNYLFLDSIPPFEGLRQKGTVEKPAVVVWDEDHPVSRFVTFGALDVTVARKIELRKEDKVVVSGTGGGDRGAPKRRRESPKTPAPPGAEPVAAEEDAAGTIPLIFEAREGDRHALVLAFDLMKTQSWPLKAAFPIFMANVVRWLGGAGREERALGIRTGDVAELSVPKGATKATVVDPQGHEHAASLKEGDDLLRYADTAIAGFYEVKFEGGDEFNKAAATRPRLYFAANLASSDESEIAPAATIELENLPVSGEVKAQEARRELWKLGAILAFLVLMLEWWVYNRRVYV